MQPTIALSSPMAHAFFHQHPDAVLVLDSLGNVLLANMGAAWLAAGDEYPNFAQMSGIAWPGDDKGELDSGRRWSRRLRIHGSDGSSRQVDVNLFGVERVAHEPQLFYCVLKDVTANIAAARAGQEVESRSRVTSDAAPVMVWMSGPDAMFEWFNKSWLAFRGRTLGDELGEGWTEGVHPEDLERCLGIYSHCFEQREPFSMDYRLLRHDGKYRWVLDTGVPRLGPDGEFLGYIGTCVDISDRKELEDKLAEHARNLRLSDRRREEFLARLSHELRNPLGPIANAAAILKALEQNDGRLVKVREILERQVEQLHRLITDLVDVTRITKGRVVLQREHVDVNAILDDALGLVQAEIDQRRQTLHAERSNEPLSCVGDAQRLAQALAALVSNASKFSPIGSPIDVAVRRAGAGGSESESVEFVVTDVGCGIAPTFLPRVFELFAQGEQSLARPEGGLGVGLTIAKSVAELHGGSVEVDSAGHGLGTMAILRIALRSAPVPGEPEPGPDLTSVEGRRVLIIEDNTDARESLRLRFELANNEVRTAADAAEGLQIAQTFEPHLVVCDIGLPDIDGYELVRKLKDTLGGHTTRFVALTGYGRVEDRDRALDSGFDAFLVKPLQPA
jgi:PAS domain S-box-containing protein